MPVRWFSGRPIIGSDHKPVIRRSSAVPTTGSLKGPMNLYEVICAASASKRTCQHALLPLKQGHISARSHERLHGVAHLP